jgi:hypothetical protein
MISHRIGAVASHYSRLANTIIKAERIQRMTQFRLPTRIIFL